MSPQKKKNNCLSQWLDYSNKTGVIVVEVVVVVSIGVVVANSPNPHRPPILAISPS
ncbi:MAG: hypothetical protein ABIA93_06860 [Candidatus Woesearchaeota archaeon]